MWVEVHYFASSRDAAGCATERVQCEPGTTLGELRALLGRERPLLARMLDTCRLALDDNFAQDDDVVAEAVTVYVLPPVSGGAGQAVAVRAQLVERQVQVGEASGRLQTGGAGAVATFCGVVRDHSKGRVVKHLDYEAHGPLAVKEMARIVDEAIGRYGLVDAFVIHRIGHLQVGEVAVDIAVCSAHRGEAFDGCRFIIDQLKQRVPIWKKETDEKGSEWVSQGP